MLGDYFKITWRNITRNRMYSMINILGLGLGMAGFIMISLWVKDEKSFDRFHRGNETVFRVVSFGEKYFENGFDGTPGPLGSASKIEIPEVIQSAKVIGLPKITYRHGENVFFEKSGLAVDESFLDLFSFELVKGDKSSVLSDPSGIVLTESMARRYFGNDDPVGKILVSEGFEGTISGVLKDVPSNSTLQFDYILPFSFYRRLGGTDDSWSAYNFMTFVRLDGHADPGLVAGMMTDLAGRNNSGQVSVDGCWYELRPLKDMHLSSITVARSYIKTGDERIVAAFSISSLLILILACINFMNLSTARSGRRAKEIGLRKVVGADRAGIIRQFYGESLFHSALAIITAIVLIEISMPWFNNMAGKALSVNYFSSWTVMLFAFTLLFTTITAGSYPALFISSFNPARVLKGRFSQGRRGILFRKVLVVSQFSLSITLLIIAVILSRQMHFMSTRNLGFDKEDLVYLPVNSEVAARYDYMKSALLEDPAVLSVSAQNSLVPEITLRNTGYDWDGRDPGHDQDIVFSAVDFDYFRTMGMEIVEGRDFSEEFSTDRTSSFILNEEAIRQMRLASPVGKNFTAGDRRGPIIGIVRDANLRSLHIKVEPHLFYITENMASMRAYGIVLVRIDGAMTDRAIDRIKTVWEDLCGSKPLEYNFMDETYDRLYKAEERAGSIINSFTSFAIIISCLGLLGLASFTAEQKRREIGIRKVLGASVPEIVYLLSKEFTRSVLLANLIAWPAAYLITRRILEIYAYRIEISPWIFIYAGTSAFVLALLTISWQALKAAVADPARVIRYE